MPTNRVAEFGANVLRSPVPVARAAEFGNNVLYRQVTHTRVAEFGINILRSFATSVMPSNGQRTRVFVISG